MNMLIAIKNLANIINFLNKEETCVDNLSMNKYMIN